MTTSDITKTQVTMATSGQHKNTDYYDNVLLTQKHRLLWQHPDIIKIQATMATSGQHKNTGYYDNVLTTGQHKLQ